MYTLDRVCGLRPVSQEQSLAAGRVPPHYCCVLRAASLAWPVQRFTRCRLTPTSYLASLCSTSSSSRPKARRAPASLTPKCVQCATPHACTRRIACRFAAAPLAPQPHRHEAPQRHEATAGRPHLSWERSRTRTSVEVEFAAKFAEFHSLAAPLAA